MPVCWMELGKSDSFGSLNRCITAVYFKVRFKKKSNSQMHKINEVLMYIFLLDLRILKTRMYIVYIKNILFTKY